MQKDSLLDKAVQGLERCDGAAVHLGHCPEDCPYLAESERADQCVEKLHADTLALLKAQDEVIDALLKVGYPHDFQREKPWIVNYMYAITDVIKKAVRLNNG